MSFTDCTGEHVTTAQAENTQKVEETSVRLLLVRLREADNASERSLVCRELAHHLARSFITLSILGLLIAVAIFEIVVGSMNIHSCPVNDMIPIWLVVDGSMNCLRYITAIIITLLGKSYFLTNVREVLECFLSIFWFIWFILGLVWTYSVSGTVEYQPGTSAYCDRLTYVLAFTIIIIINVLIGLLLICCLCVCCFFIFLAHSRS